MKTEKWLGLLIMSAMILGGCAGEAAPERIVELEDSALEKPQTVEVVRGDMCIATYYDAYVGPEVEQLTFAKEGVFGKFEVQLGDKVKKGDRIASPALDSIESRIESSEEQVETLTNTYHYERATLENSLAIVKLELENVYEELENLEYLSQEFTAACMEAGQYDEQRKRLELQLKQLQETYDLELPYYQKQLQKLREACTENVITAPFDGTIVALAEEGEYGAAIDLGRYYAAVADTSVNYARCSAISENILNKLEKVLFVTGKKEYEAIPVPMDFDYYLATKNNKELAYSEFEIADPDGNLSYGDYGKIKLVSAEKKDILMLPETAVNLSGGKYYVYMDVNGQYTSVAVEVGQKDGIRVEIVKGLEEGDIVYVQE